ncbi:ribonuclease [Erythrobacter sp. LQ02-29]|uniref:ribonuclease n=1 Tax=Erythrobacter sp. LQ02-29 TaxID=2920384 RepID=UPI001F4DFAD1|nr:ribonuclease [Erythrobacter sp. LQ02-29]MCP9223817.1 ribonuclease [Erythrobacter sp. LQ02-29]
MAEWLVEEGIGEHRAIRVENGEIAAARLDWPGRLAAGQVIEAKLVQRSVGSARGMAQTDRGDDILLDRLPRDASEGASVRVAISRAAIAERGRLKRAQGRSTDEPLRPAPTLAGRLRDEGHSVTTVRHFPEGDWDALFADAWSGAVDFAGGSLLFADTPAMTLIDIDGDTRDLSQAAIPAIASALRRFDMGGVIGIDFPTPEGKPARQAIDRALAEALADWPHERTAINGFGFVQLVARLTGPSLLQRIGRARIGAAARILLRRAERLEGAGATLVTCHPAIKAKLKPEWLAELARRTGREVRVQTAPALAIEAGHAQLVER